MQDPVILFCSTVTRLVIKPLVVVSFDLFASWQCLRAANDEVEKVAAIAEQEKLMNIDMEKRLQALGLPSTITPVPSPDRDLQLALQEKDK